MEKSKHVTIITVTLNRPSLKDACESVNSQTYTNWDHVVLGDGVMPEVYPSPQRSTLGFSEPLGATEPGANMLNGTPNPLLRWALKHVKMGEYMCFLDDDNMYMPDFLEKMVEALDRHPEAGIVLCGAEDVRYHQNIDGYPEMSRCDNSAFLARSELTQTIEYPHATLDKNVIQDYEFIKLCAEKGGWIRIPEKLLIFGHGMNPPPNRGKVLFLESWKLGQTANDYLNTGDFDLAETLFLQAISIYDGDAWSWRRLAELYLLQNRFSESKKAFQHWLMLYNRIDPSHYAAQFSHAIYLKHNGAAYEVEMEQSLMKRMELERIEPEAYEHSIYVLLSMLFLEQEEAAWQQLQKCIQIHANTVQWASKDALWLLKVYQNEFNMDIDPYITFFEGK